ncbi:hypothetical protein RFI_18598 [Reticulomyxa filosa]|uniref:Uncharacterized protein n=1 Tax=Reticulomyxa filosa TaxID=46433 RepID=X6MYF3_RETFI|nr:hypothetical protein RFI_18598 [Reticulomyxa filosa]|eukprot:ETO18663.1 hypothetical protein RFI_18598 [Reticulomyxa filosa]
MRVRISGLFKDVNQTYVNMTFFTVLGVPRLFNPILFYDNSSVALSLSKTSITFAEPVSMKVTVGNLSIPLIVGLEPLSSSLSSSSSSFISLGCYPSYAASQYNTFGWLSNSYFLILDGSYSIGVYWVSPDADRHNWSMYALTGDFPSSLSFIVDVFTDYDNNNNTLSLSTDNSFVTQLKLGEVTTLYITTAFNTSTLMSCAIVQERDGKTVYNSSITYFEYDSAATSNQLSILVPDDLSTEDDVKTFIMFTAYDCSDSDKLSTKVELQFAVSKSSSTSANVIVISLFAVAVVGAVVSFIVWWWCKCTKSRGDYTAIHNK